MCYFFGNCLRFVGQRTVGQSTVIPNPVFRNTLHCGVLNSLVYELDFNAWKVRETVAII